MPLVIKITKNICRLYKSQGFQSKFKTRNLQCFEFFHFSRIYMILYLIFIPSLKTVPYVQKCFLVFRDCLQCSWWNVFCPKIRSYICFQYVIDKFFSRPTIALFYLYLLTQLSIISRGRNETIQVAIYVIQKVKINFDKYFILYIFIYLILYAPHVL